CGSRATDRRFRLGSGGGGNRPGVLDGEASGAASPGPPGDPAASPSGPRMSEQQVSVERLEVRTDDVAAVTDLVNAVYAVAEDGMWLAGTARTDRDEIECCAREGTVRLARLDGQVVGCIRVVRIDDTTAEFGMLAVDPTIRGKGIGRKLIDSAESECAARGFETMQLEVIRPRDRSL